jgi:hypothetical protein
MEITDQEIIERARQIMIHRAAEIELAAAQWRADEPRREAESAKIAFNVMICFIGFIGTLIVLTHLPV